MKNYLGFLIRQTRLRQNISQAGLCKGICTPSYLSKIEQGQVEAGNEIIEQLFLALGIQYEKSSEILDKAERCLEICFSLWEVEESFEKEFAPIWEHREELEHSELHLDYHLCLMCFYLTENKRESAEKEYHYLSKFIPYMEEIQLVRYYLGVAEIQEDSDAALQILKKAARYGKQSIIYYRLATILYHIGRYDACMEQAENAYRFAAEDGNPFVLIGASFLLGSCYCNSGSLSSAERFYNRAVALTRGYKTSVKNYAYYNLGTSYLAMEEYKKAEYYLAQVEELEEEPYHNIILHQKKALLFVRTGRLEEASRCIKQAKRLLKILPDSKEAYILCEKMIVFVELLLEQDYLKNPSYGSLLKSLYEEIERPFGFGFRRFYGLFLIEWYKYQRKYKDAVRVLEEITIS